MAPGPGGRLGDPALIHAHTGYPDGAAAAHLSERVGCPLIVTEHSSMVARHLSNPIQREWYLRAIDRASRFVAVSETLASELRAALPERAEKIVVIPNAVRIDDFVIEPAEMRVADQLLFVGYLKETKGIATLLEAFARVRATRPAATLVLVGEAPTPELRSRWEALADQLGIAGAVRFAGALDRAGVATAMSAATLFVHPSPRETFGVVAVEALASGLPVVATDSGGVTEVLGSDPNKVGAVVPPGDADALARAILVTLERIDAFDPEQLRASVAARFGSRAVATRLLDLYREVLDRAPTAGTASAAVPGGVGGGPSLPRHARRSGPLAFRAGSSWPASTGPGWLSCLPVSSRSSEHGSPLPQPPVPQPFRLIWRRCRSSSSTNEPPGTSRCCGRLAMAEVGLPGSPGCSGIRGP